MFSSTDLKQRWWMHRDQKLAYDPVRDAEHVRAHPNAFSVTRCYQSSLYLTDSVDEGDDGFVCCPGSHAWPDGDGWENSRDRHHVSVPPDDPRVVRAVSKLVVRRGEMIVWDSRLAHMGGYLRPRPPGRREASSSDRSGSPSSTLRTTRPCAPRSTRTACVS